MEEDFEISNRPNFELKQAIAWAISGGVTIIGAASLGVGVLSSLLLGAPSIYMTIKRLIPAEKRIEKIKLMKGVDSEEITVKQLRDKVIAHPNELWLGKGFEWGPDQVQAMHDILNSNPEKNMPKESMEGGYRWLQGLGVPKDIYIPIKFFAGHTLIIGTTGAGKTRFADNFVSQLIARGETVIVIDPKGDREMATNCRTACEELGQPERFAYFNTAFPNKSVKLDPLKNFAEVTELPSRLTQVISNGASDNDPFVNFFWDVTNSIIQALVYIGDRPTLYKIFYYASSTISVGELIVKGVKKHISCIQDKLPDNWEKRLQIAIKSAGKTGSEAAGYGSFYFDQLRENFPQSALDGIWGIYNKDAAHYQKMIGGVIPTMTQLTSDAGRFLLSPEVSLEDETPVLDMGKVVNNNMVLYLGLNSMPNRTVASAIGSILLADAVAYAGSVYNYVEEKDMRVVNIFVDEAAEVVNAALIQILNKGRGAKFRVFMATQAYADFVARLGDDSMARQVLANLNQAIFLRTPEAQTQKFLEDSLRKVPIKRLDMKHSGGVNPELTSTTRGNYAEGLEREVVPMVDGWMMGHIPDLHFFFKKTGGTLYKCQIPIVKSKKAA